MVKDIPQQSPANRQAAALLNSAMRQHQAGQIAQALTLYRQVLAEDANNATALYYGGLAEHQLGYHERAIELLQAAVSRNERIPDLHYNLATILQTVERLDEAASHMRRAIALNGSSAPAHFEFGNILMRQERPVDAVAHYEKAIALQPRYIEALTNLGNALRQSGRINDAMTCWQNALELDPNYVLARVNLGIALKAQGRNDDAVAMLHQAAQAAPDSADAAYNLATALLLQGDANGAASQFKRALALQPNFADAKFGICMAQLPLLYEAEAEIAERRAAYSQHLDALCNEAQTSEAKRELARGVAASQPFYLGYQGQCDRDLQRQYGSLVCDITSELYPATTLPSPPATDEPVRIGVVSGFFCDHTVWKLFIKGWLEQFDRKRFHVHGYHTGHRRDATTAAAAMACDQFVAGPHSPETWRQTILNDRPHVLIYPEIGMDPIAARLAAQRLAPVQCVSWGHPETTGMPSIDYFLSSDDMEPPDGESHYTERLVRLPRTSIYYDPASPVPGSLKREALGLRPDATVYWSGQALYKYLPQDDQIFARIAADAGNSQFVFIQYPGSTRINELFCRRIERAFADCGLNAADHFVLLPRLDSAAFIEAIGLCDIVLDSIGWSGGNTTLESLAHNLPIVTLPGPLMRGRHTLAFLKAMEIMETVASTPDDYVTIAARLAKDALWRGEIKSKIAARKHRLFRDRAPVAALEEFLERAVRGT